VVAVANELQEQLLAREEKAKITDKDLVKVNADLDTEWAKAKATQKEYLDKMEAYITHAKHSLGPDKMLWEKKFELDARERDLGLCDAALVEAKSRGLNLWDKHEELMEFVELRRLLKEAKVEHIAEAG
jgi:hypothetical protein